VGNLISNAIKFTPEGHVRVLLGVWPSAQIAHVSLSVEDSGTGIAESEVQRLGRAYQQVRNSAVPPRMGAGLGLSICRSLLSLMKGTLRLQSVLGRGTRVEFQLDATLCAPPQDAARVQDPVTVESALQVLVVDDYAANRILLERQLTFLGHRVTLAEHGAAGLRAWLRGNFDVVISDCNMPGMNGYQLARAIREHERRKSTSACLLLGCTANAQLQERDLCVAHGMDDCLFKPLSLQGLADILSSRRRHWQKPCDSDEIDLSGLHQLTAGDELSLKRLLADLALSNGDDLCRLQALGEPYNHALIGDLVHRIKGGARIVRAGRLVTACEALEQTCHPAASAIDVRRGIDDLAGAMSSLGQYLERYCRAR
jgi:two-component system sensor histidine kinase EvgS